MSRKITDKEIKSYEEIRQTLDEQLVNSLKLAQEVLILSENLEKALATVQVKIDELEREKTDDQPK